MKERRKEEKEKTFSPGEKGRSKEVAKTKKKWTREVGKTYERINKEKE